MYKYILALAVIIIFTPFSFIFGQDAPTIPKTTSEKVITDLQQDAFGLNTVAELLGLCDNDPSTPDTSIQDCKKPVDIRVILFRIIQLVLGFTSIIALVFVLYGGFTWTTAAGSEEKVKKGKGILVWALIGLVVVVAAWSIITYVMMTIGQTI